MAAPASERSPAGREKVMGSLSSSSHIKPDLCRVQPISPDETSYVRQIWFKGFPELLCDRASGNHPLVGNRVGLVARYPDNGAQTSSKGTTPMSAAETPRLPPT